MLIANPHKTDIIDKSSEVNEIFVIHYVLVLSIFLVFIRLIFHYLASRQTDILMNILFIIGLGFSILLLKKNKIFMTKIFFAIMFIVYSLILFSIRGLDMIPWIFIFPVGSILLFGVIGGLIWCFVYVLLASQILYIIWDSLILTFSLKMLIFESITVFFVSIVFASLYDYMVSHRIKKLVYTSNHDKLTGLFNRHFFYEYALKELQKSKRFGQNLSLLSFDIDFFKNVNDTYGHAAGDSVLKTLTSVIDHEIRKSDIFARLGGDEFVILLFNVDEASSLLFANKLLDVVRFTSFEFVDNVTISMGLSVVKDEDSLDSFIKRSDDALYEAKRQGRDKVCTV